MIVGYESKGYSEQRNIIDIVAGVDYRKIYNVYALARRTQRAFEKLTPNLPWLNDVDVQFRFRDPGCNRAHIMHFFNTISFSRTPWVTTFETVVPRYKSTLSLHHGPQVTFEALKDDKQVLKAMEALSGESCKKLIAMSECNLKMQRDLLTHFPQYSKRIDEKLLHLHPPQELIVDSYESKNLSISGNIQFMFVGMSFFRKGGMEVLEAFSDAVRDKGYDITLTIVSSLAIDSYATKETEQDVRRAGDFIHDNRSWINYYESMPNEDVIELMKSAHVGLLPTYADTYGYSVLEFQACGCPVVSTNVRALPEINNDRVGWMIDIPRNRLGEAIYTTNESRSAIRLAIKRGLKNVIDEIMADRQSIPRKADAALNRIREQHAPERFAGKMSEIYMAGV